MIPNQLHIWSSWKRRFHTPSCRSYDARIVLTQPNEDGNWMNLIIPYLVIPSYKSVTSQSSQSSHSYPLHIVEHLRTWRARPPRTWKRWSLRGAWETCQDQCPHGVASWETCQESFVMQTVMQAVASLRQVFIASHCFVLLRPRTQQYPSAALWAAAPAQPGTRVSHRTRSTN